METAIAERESDGSYRSLEDFCSRIDSRSANRRVIESLVRCGAFDFTKIDRAVLFASVEATLASAASAHRDKAAGQVSLFDMFESAPAPTTLAEMPHVEPWSQAERLAAEKELLGFYVTGHPLDSWRETLENGGYVSVAMMREIEDKTIIEAAGMIVSVEKRFTKKENKQYAICQMEDLTGQAEVMIWPETFSKTGQLLETGKVLVVTAKLDKREDKPRLVATELKVIKESKGGSAIRLTMQHELLEVEELARLRETLHRYPGKTPVILNFQFGTGERVVMKTDKKYHVKDTPELREALTGWLV